MGGWVLEVAKMAMYMSFPVCMFHYFNQPEYFEEWVTKTRRELFPPENKENIKQVENCIKAIQEQYDAELREKLKQAMKS